MKFLLSTVFLLLSVSISTAVEQPNIVVFLVDDMGVMDTSVPFLTDADGEPKRYPLNDFYRTPNMERLAKLGVRFNNFNAMSVCSPTRISIMTGQNAARHHTTTWISPETNNVGKYGPPEWNWNGLNRDRLTLPRLLQTAGYRTIHVGKGHFGPDDSEGAEPLNLGFDVNVAGRSIGAPGSYFGADNYGNPVKGKPNKRRNRAVPHLEKYHGTKTHLTDALTIEALAHVSASVKEERPFFLYLSHYAVHGPHQLDPRFADNYKDSKQPERGQAFATLVEGMDKSLGEVMDALGELGVAENTLIIFLGDNGSDAPLGNEHAVACAAPLRGKKGSHYEGGFRVPFIAAWAKPNSSLPVQKRLPIAAEKIQEQSANVCDLFPTITRLTGIDTPTGHKVDGSPLHKLFTGESDAEHSDEFLMHFPHEPHRSTYYTAFRDGDWKVIYHYYPGDDSEGQRYQLFNLANDPFEQKNLADANPKELHGMMQGLVKSLEQHGAQYVVDANDKTRRLKPVVPSSGK